MEKFKLGRYKHFKGNEYLAFAIANDSESLEKMVVYKALYGDGECWVRPMSMFCEEIVRDGKCIKRFEYLGK